MSWADRARRARAASRRLFSCLGSRARLRHRFHRVDDGVVTGAAAVVAGEMFADFIAARHAAALQQILRCRNHAGRAVAALQRVALLEGQLQIGNFAGIRNALDGLDRGAVALHRQHQAAAHDLAVHPHGAGAADAMLAADMAAGERQILAQEIDQRLARFDALADALAVDGEGNVESLVAHQRGSMSWVATRRSSTPARCFFTAPVACTSSCGSRSSAATAASTLPATSAASAFFARSGVAPTPKKASRTSANLELLPLPSARALAARPTMA